MRSRTAHRRITSAALFTTALLVGSSPLRAQNVKVNIPGGAFNSVGGRVAVDDVGGGRRFRGEAFELVTLQAKLQMPSTSVAEPRLQRLVIRFRTSASGPSLRAVELRNGSHRAFRLETNIGGDFATRETAAPPASANTWDFARVPARVGSNSVLRLEVQYPGGFDSQVNPGDFVMLSAQTEFVRKPQTSTTAVLESPIRVAGRGRLTNRVEAGPVVSAATLPSESKGVIYAVSGNKELQWYRHAGRDDGTFNWAGSTARTVERGWDFRQIVPADDGVIYAITADGGLLWYRQDGRDDGKRGTVDSRAAPLARAGDPALHRQQRIPDLREEREKGSLEPGKLADFIVLDRDILTCPVGQSRISRWRPRILAAAACTPSRALSAPERAASVRAILKELGRPREAAISAGG